MLNSRIINRVDINYLQEDVVLCELALVLPILGAAKSVAGFKRQFLDGKNDKLPVLSSVIIGVDEKETCIEVFQTRGKKAPLLLMKYS